MTSSDRGKFAESIAKGYGKKAGDEPAEDEEPKDMGSDDDAAKEAAGEELADALKSGNGAEIYRAFEALKELCDGG